jgi:hypothetical protein
MGEKTSGAKEKIKSVFGRDEDEGGEGDDG